MVTKNSIRKYGTVIWTLYHWVNSDFKVSFIFQKNYLGFLHILKLILDLKQCLTGNKLNFGPCLVLSQLVEKFIIIIILNSDNLVQAPQTVQTLHDFQLLLGHKFGLHFSGMLLPINAI